MLLAYRQWSDLIESVRMVYWVSDHQLIELTIVEPIAMVDTETIVVAIDVTIVV